MKINFMKITFTVLSTLAVSSMFAQCPVGSPCAQQQGSYYQGGYQGDYQGGYQGGYQGSYQGRGNQGYRGQPSNAGGGYSRSNNMGNTYHSEPPTRNADGTMTYQGLPVYMEPNSPPNPNMQGQPQPSGAPAQANVPATN